MNGVMSDTFYGKVPLLVFIALKDFLQRQSVKLQPIQNLALEITKLNKNPLIRNLHVK